MKVWKLQLVTAWSWIGICCCVTNSKKLVTINFYCFINDRFLKHLPYYTNYILLSINLIFFSRLKIGLMSYNQIHFWAACLMFNFYTPNITTVMAPNSFCCCMSWTVTGQLLPLLSVLMKGRSTLHFNIKKTIKNDFQKLANKLFPKSFQMWITVVLESGINRESDL